MTMKDFAIIGLGNFGAAVARTLADLECRVTAIDTRKDRLELVDKHVDVAIHADASDRKFLESLEPPEFDCFVVSTGTDEHASVLITLYLKELKAEQIVVKAHSSAHARILMKVGADEALIPEEKMAFRLAHSLARPDMIDHLPLTSGFYVVQLNAPESFVGKTLAELDIRAKYSVQIIAIKDSRTGELNLVPYGPYKVKENDILFVIGRSEDIDKIKG